MNVSEFIAKWQRVELTERAAAQQHFLDLCELLGHPKPADVDPTGAWFTFEKGATKQSGGEGFADVWKKGCFGWEYKGKHKDLAAAYDQLLQYREALENPPLLVVCDMDRIQVHTNFTNTPVRVYEIPLSELGEPRNLEIIRHVFNDPDKLKPGATSAAITAHAAERLGEIAQSMRGRGLDPHQVARFLDRIVFCLFAQDVELLPRELFSQLVRNTQGDPARFRKLVGQLFEAMTSGGDFGAQSIKNFNGDLFTECPVPEVTSDEIEAILGVAGLDWAAIDPSIFGTLFERGMDPSKRAQIGAHYTSREDIEVLVEPVVMQPLRREWAETREIAQNLLATGSKKPAVVAEPPSAGQDSAVQAKPASGAYRRNLPHLQRESATLFVTFRTTSHLQLPPLARTEVLRHCLHDHAVKAWVHGVVVMPDHVHMVMTPLADSAGNTFGLAEIMNGIKGAAAHTVNKLLHRRGRVWQDESFDHILRSDESAQEKVEYLCQNPVRKGLVQDGEDYPWLWREWIQGQQNAVVAQPPSAGQTLTAQAGTPVPQESSGPQSQARAPMLQRNKARREAEALIRRFLISLQNIKVLDPACGSGNFLYVSLQKLKDLEKEVSFFAGRNGLHGFLPAVGPWQLYGIEINPYAHELAQMTVWIGYLQWIRANGYGSPEEPVLRKMNNFRCMDAIIDLTDPNNPKEPEWPKVDLIVGNPPFLGGGLLRNALGDEYVEKLFAEYRERIPNFSDLCCYWFEKARHQIELGKCKRAGLLATQGIRGGANREVLRRIKETGDIFFAESDRPWILDGANVHVSMIGFDDRSESRKILNGSIVSTINPNLTSVVDVTAAAVLTENAGVCYMGPSPKAPFDIAEELALRILKDCGNVHGKPNSDVVRRVASAVDLTKEDRKVWTIDFGLLPHDEACKYQTPFEHAKATVYPVRRGNRRQTNLAWWQYERPRVDMRKALSGLVRFVATPGVSKYRVFVWRTPEFLCNQGTLLFARSDDYFFGILHSRLHEVWARAQGTQLRERESGFRYTPTTCFETFPLPRPNPEQERAIADAAKELDALRNAWLNPPEWTKEEVLEFPGSVSGPWARFVHEPDARGIGTVRYPRLVPKDADSAKQLAKRTLTNLYNERPAWLTQAHRKLDDAVFAAYGWDAPMADEHILEKLLALNLERAT